MVAPTAGIPSQRRERGVVPHLPTYCRSGEPAIATAMPRRVRRRRSRRIAARPSGRRRRPGCADPTSSAGCTGSGRRTTQRSVRRRWTCRRTAWAEPGRRSRSSSWNRSPRSPRQIPTPRKPVEAASTSRSLPPSRPRRSSRRSTSHRGPRRRAAQGRAGGRTTSTSPRSRRWHRWPTARERAGRRRRRSRGGQGTSDVFRPSFRWRPCFRSSR